MTEKEARHRNAKDKRGRNAILLERTVDTDGEPMDLFRMVANENEGLRTIADVKKWMEENNHIGTLYPVRIQKPITRAEQKVIKFI